MTEWVLPLAVGTATGILSAWGVGGGTLLLLVMTLFLGVDQRTAQGINLLYFLPTAGAGLLFHRKAGMLDKQALRQAIPWGVATQDAAGGDGGAGRVVRHCHGYGAAAQAVRGISAGDGRDNADKKA